MPAAIDLFADDPAALRAALEATVGPLPEVRTGDRRLTVDVSGHNRGIGDDPLEVLGDAKALLALYGALVELQATPAPAARLLGDAWMELIRAKPGEEVCGHLVSASGVEDRRCIRSAADKGTHVHVYAPAVES